MSINYSGKLGKYVCQSVTGEVLGIHDPSVHGDLDGFRNAMARLSHE